jgi:uracil phosphoribosyltransferase
MPRMTSTKSAKVSLSVAAVDRLKERGARELRFVCLITVPAAIERPRGIHPDAYIIPGLGDAGDRAFGTR